MNLSKKGLKGQYMEQDEDFAEEMTDAEIDEMLEDNEKYWQSVDNFRELPDDDHLDDVEIDKCLNCGRYRATDSLNENQVCIKPCRNPNEH